MKKKIVFIAHEFGFFKGHGGIASYLSSIVGYILKNYPNLSVYLLIDQYDKKSLKAKPKNLHVVRVRNEDDVFTELLKIKPDYVETMDFLGWCTRAMIAKCMGQLFQKTVFALMHHTAIRESCEWNTQLPLEFMHPWMQDAFMQEKAQMMMADIQMAPCSFMAKYVSKNYAITDKIYVFPHHNEFAAMSKNKVIKEVDKQIDITPYKDTFNVFFISRIEGRKNQIYLVKEFCRFVDETNVRARLFLAGNSDPHEVTGIDKRYVLFSQIPKKYRDKILIFDFINQKQQMALAAIGDVCVLPSFYESFSVAMVETLLKGVPLIATKNSGCGDYIQPCWQFDPFVSGSLCDKLKTFYKLKQSERQKIHTEQIKKYIEISDPKNSIDLRLKIFDSYKYLPPKPENFILIDSEHWHDLSLKFMDNTENFILMTNSVKENLAVVLAFSNNFSWPRNSHEKIIVLNNSYTYLKNLQDAVNIGLPLFIRGVDTKHFDKHRPIYQNLLDIAIDKEIVSLRLDNIHSGILDKTITDYVFMTSKKLDLKGKFYDK